MVWKSFGFGVASAPYYFLAFGLVSLVVFAMHKLENSRIGRTWIAVREDELAASSVGVNVNKTKLLACGLGAAIAGIAGCLFAAKQGSVSPDSFDFIVSVMVVAMVVLGGFGSIAGAILGAVVLTVLPEMFREMATYRMLLFGLAMILIAILRPQGLLGDVRHARELKVRPEGKS
jgi:branched-chain amino acid transport system permease protein